MLATKLRALYQRKKSRDLFDLSWAYLNMKVDTGKLLHCYKKYMQFDVEHPPTRKVFIANMDGLPVSPFRTDDWKGITE